MQKSLRALLLLLFVGLLAPAAYSQGTLYSYVFSGDTSPLNVSVTFTATRDAVATGSLTETNILNSRILLGDGRSAPIGLMFFPVKPPEYGGTPLNDIDGHYLKAFAFFGMDYAEVTHGAQGYSADVYFYPWVGSPQSYPSAGKWSVAVVPEPASLSLLVVAGCCCWRARRLPQRARR